MTEIQKISSRYDIRTLREEDIPDIYALCRENPLYYTHCPPFVSEESIHADMQALPPGKTYEDKYYLGYYDGTQLIAVLDLILSYPDAETAFVGFFMMDTNRQGKGLGSALITELCAFLADNGYRHVRLGWVKGNPQAEHFWHKNMFKETGVTAHTENYDIILAQREL